METIANLERRTIDALKDLIAANLDSLQLCEVATDRVDDPVAAAAFHGLGEDRRQQARELQSYLRLNQDPAGPEGTTIGVLHNMWTDLRAALNDGDPYVVLIEAVRGEERMDETYSDAIREIPGSPLNGVLLRHLAAIRKSRAALLELREVAYAVSTTAIV